MSSSVASPASGQVNPTLCMQAAFVAKTDDKEVTTPFPLDKAPEIESWLMSFVDFYLAKDGKLAGNKTIAPPPRGAIRDELIRGGVIFATKQPNGDLELWLNPQHSIWLVINVRRRNQPALHTYVAIRNEPEVAKWLLSYRLPADVTADHLPVSDAIFSRLREIGVIVDEFPAPGLCFPDPKGPADAVRELSIAAQTFVQAAGQDIPTTVREVLGKHEPALPADTELRWLQDAGTGLMFPSCSTVQIEPEQLDDATAGPATQRATEWQQLRTEAQQSLKTQRYAVLRNIFPPAQREMLRQYVRELVARGYFPELGDGQVELRAAIHNEKTIASFHHGLATLLRDICEKPPIASYCYLACYEAGAVLERHVDRSQCTYNLSVIFDMDGPDGEPDPWPIYVDIDAKPVAINLNIGDGLLYSGTELLHWRDALPEGQRVIACFYHFVGDDFHGSLD